MSLPNWWEAPSALLETEGHCGLLAAWMVLDHFEKRVSREQLIRSCRYTKKHGVFTVGLAACLKTHGLQVSFYTDPDPEIDGFEKQCYSRAARMGILPHPALKLSEVLLELRRGSIPIVLFNSESGAGHFSPLLGLRKGMLRLPLADEAKLPKSKFLARWSAPGILRQCVIAGI